MTVSVCSDYFHVTNTLIYIGNATQRSEGIQPPAVRCAAFC